MSQLYGTFVTDIGKGLIAEALAKGIKLNITKAAVGDGGGAYYMPAPDMIKLKRQTWSGEINSVEIGGSTNTIEVVAVIPSDVGGFTIREMAIFTDDGKMFAICNTPDTEKVVITSGAAGEIEVVIRIEVSNTDAISFIIDPNVILATKSDIEKHNKAADAHKALFEKVAGSIEAVTFGFSGTLSNTGWSGSSAPYLKSVTVEGIIATAKPPIIDIEFSTEWTDLEEEEVAWGSIKRIAYDDNMLTFYAEKVPTVNMNFKGVQIK